MEAAWDPRVRRTVAAFVQAFSGTPWRVQPTPDGAVVSLDVADAQWWRAMRREGLTESCVFTLGFDPERGTCTVVDEHRVIEWRAGLNGESRPSVDGASRARRGWPVASRGRRASTASDDAGSVFRPERTRAVLHGILERFEWGGSWGAPRRTGPWLALVLVLIALAGVGVVLALMTG